MAEYTRENYEKVKELIGQGIFLEDFRKMNKVPEEELNYIFRAFRKKRHLIFLTKLQELDYLAPKETYMQINGISDKIVCDNNLIKICVIADSHFGSIDDNPHILDKVYEFCTEMNIHDIIHLGDFVEGNDYHILHKDEHKLRYGISEEKQFAYLQGCIPFDKNITIHIDEGNHDVFSNTGLANDVLFKFIQQYDRKDMRIVGYDFAEFQINDSVIYLNHGAISDVSKLSPSYTKNLILSGHSHMTECTVYDDGPTFIDKRVVSLSNIKHGNDPTNNFTGFATLDIYLDDNGEFSQYLIKDYKIDSNLYDKPVCVGGEIKSFTRRLTK